MNNITLRSIFCHLTNDDNFLSTIIESSHEKMKHKKKKNNFNLMANMVTEYVPLSPHETQIYSLFPNKIKSYLSPDYIRFGIKNVIEKSLNIVNISFLNSLNILLRPDIYKLNVEDHIRNLNLLESFISHKIQRNCQIDKTKNTRKVQAVNKELIKNLQEGKISHELIQKIVNIFEINLLVFDFTKIDIYLYWCKGYKYPFVNLFKNLYCMAHIQGNYEPIISADKNIPKEQIYKMYVHILTNLDEIKCIPNLDLAVHSLLFINSWDISLESYIKILETFFNKPPKNMDDCLKILKKK